MFVEPAARLLHGVAVLDAVDGDGQSRSPYAIAAGKLAPQPSQRQIEQRHEGREGGVPILGVVPRLDRGTQYAAASPYPTAASGILDRPVEPGDDRGVMARRSDLHTDIARAQCASCVKTKS
ncbi:hypothetical protein FNJ47_24280 [Bradyrhizobium sp. UFLA 03-164]|uniref:Uncharacterized protein n=1 Tax=Bradyrhizobium uaiense TaxID=2594946 RepID=A0A6P1BKX1_9BRAD|nr:hypothetical protein [Bradyrhizobium uaiense]